MPRTMTSRALAFTGLALAALALGGCLISSSSSAYQSGRRVGDETRAQIHPGQTTREWLLAALGEPTSRRAVEDEAGAVEIWRYDYIERRESDGTVFLLFAGSSSRSTTNSTFFEITDGVVTAYWSE